MNLLTFFSTTRAPHHLIQTQTHSFLLYQCFKYEDVFHIEVYKEQRNKRKELQVFKSVKMAKRNLLRYARHSSCSLEESRLKKEEFGEIREYMSDPPDLPAIRPMVEKCVDGKLCDHY